MAEGVGGTGEANWELLQKLCPETRKAAPEDGLVVKYGMTSWIEVIENPHPSEQALMEHYPLDRSRPLQAGQGALSVFRSRPQTNPD